MEETKSTRSVVQSAFTRSINTLSQNLKQEPVNVHSVQAHFQLLEEKCTELDTLNAKIFELTVEEGIEDKEIDAELEMADEYKLKYLHVKIEVSTLLHRHQSSLVSENRINSPTQPPPTPSVVANTRRSFKLPKIELKKFSGEVRE